MASLKCKLCKHEIKRRSDACVYYRFTHWGVHYLMPMHISCATGDADARKHTIHLDAVAQVMKDFTNELLFGWGIAALFCAGLYLYSLNGSSMGAWEIIVAGAVFAAAYSIVPVLSIRTLDRLRRLPR